ncbi:hypothetical protein PMA3_16100 [Pseudomonas silesiensis]|uniref:Uncharacterized protein n=1 Tax=Pseudomonas silesiensis TaxID=1853130 RepID=A0A191YV03_9PSED|nr:hypothetical protein [Pseudomonas silesiensis]ANJ56584.1 hypothetical protein PMA3_16100 [Pseudomonas silesiensis]
MNSELSIRIDFNKRRENPAQVFEAMGLYINSYRDLCQVLANSIDLKMDFEFQLDAVEEGSLISKLSHLKNGVDDFFGRLFCDSGMALFDELVEIDETATEEEVDAIASTLESRLAAEIPEALVDPFVDRQALAFVLQSLSSANRRMQPGEKVELYTDEEGVRHALNTEWSFTADPKKMFAGVSQEFDGRDKLYATIPVNEGNSVWTFRSPATHQKFSAKVVNKEWLERYQNGLIPAIGPLDLLDAELSYIVYTPPKGKGKPQIRNAKIKNVLGVRRAHEKQHALGV